MVSFEFYFQIRNKENNKCIDSMGRKSGEKTGFVHCHSQGGNQVWLNKVFQSIPTNFFFFLKEKPYHSVFTKCGEP